MDLNQEFYPVKHDNALLNAATKTSVSCEEANMLHSRLARLEAFRDIVVEELGKMPDTRTRDLLLRLAEITI